MTAPTSSPADLGTALSELIACPRCRGKVDWSRNSISCTHCALRFPIVDGIPVMLIQEQSDGLDPNDTQKKKQMEFFDRENDDFETTRPHGTPRLYRWMLEEKFRRSVQGLEPLPRTIALTVCGGSGMDAEFLCRRGHSVISSDISLGAARRARARASLFNLAIAPIVADVEMLPFADRSIDLVYVHDGLHHLEDPFLGIREMARVASSAVSITEPGRAAVTSLAVKLGLSVEVEEAGNRVARLSPGAVAGALKASGLEITNLERYAMYYRHDPGRVFELLSTRAAFLPAVTAWKAINRGLGSFGNKLTITAKRPSSHHLDSLPATTRELT